jgi:diguanylate cyclase (GGDEF)-like protein
MNLSVNTINAVIWAYFLSLVVVWTYIAYRYPSFRPARTWQIATALATAGATFGGLRGILPNVWPAVVGNGLSMAAICMVWAGIRQYQRLPAPVVPSLIICLATPALLTLDLVLNDSIATRLTLLAFAQSLVFVGVIRDLGIDGWSRREPGAMIVAAMAGLLIVAHVVRGAAAIMGVGGTLQFVEFNAVQATLLLSLVVCGMIGHFGLVLMAIDRLREELTALAHADDLTGIANRREFLARLADACRSATRTGRSFTLMVIDLDGFKSINDSFGHGAGDECLRAFTSAAGKRLRPQDLIARTGGDEFCVILPGSTLTESALAARGVIKSCRQTLVPWNGQRIAITASIGIAEWSPRIGEDVARLIHEADEALYVAKRQGRDRLAVFDARAALRLPA